MSENLKIRLSLLRKAVHRWGIEILRARADVLEGACRQIIQDEDFSRWQKMGPIEQPESLYLPVQRPPIESIHPPKNGNPLCTPIKYTPRTIWIIDGGEVPKLYEVKPFVFGKDIPKINMHLKEEDVSIPSTWWVQATIIANRKYESRRP